MNFKITPSEFLREIGWQFTARGSWLSLKYCPFCQGGGSGDKFTFIVHSKDGNYSCQRSKCGERGSFWKLIESQGRDPREYVGERAAGYRSHKKKYMYGRQA